MTRRGWGGAVLIVVALAILAYARCSPGAPPLSRHIAPAPPADLPAQPPVTRSLEPSFIAFPLDPPPFELTHLRVTSRHRAAVALPPVSPGPAPAAARPVTMRADVVPARQAALVTLVLNGQAYGDIVVYLQPSSPGEAILAQPSDLERAGLHPDGPTVLLDGKRLLSLDSLAPLITTVLDQDGMILRLTADPSLLQHTTISAATRAPADIVYRSATSAFVNYAVTAHDLDAISGFAEAGLSVGGALLYSSATWTSGALPVRGMTNVTVDDRAHMRRYIFGDSFAGAGPLGGALFLAGVQLTRSFELDPYFVQSPSLGAQGAVLEASTADIYVNGVLVRRETLPAGTFNIKDLPAVTGAGDVRVVLRDALGRQTDISTSYYMPAGLLARGLSDYSYALGFRRDQSGVDSWDYGAPALIAHHRVGLTDRFTLAARLELSTDLVSGGGTAVFGIPWGQLEISGAASGGGGRAGVAATLAYTYSSRRLGLMAYTRVLSDGYATLALAPRDDRPRLEYGGSLSLPAGRRLTFSAQLSDSEFRDSGLESRAALVASIRLARHVQLILSGSRTVIDGGTPAFEAYANLSLSLGPRTTASLQSQVSAAGAQESINVQRTLPEGPGWGYRLAGQVGGGSARASTEIDAQTDFGRYSAAYDWHDGAGAATLSAAGGIVFIGGRVFFKPPVTQSFALVQVPDVAGVRVYLDNREVGRTNASGDFLVNDLLGYYGNRIAIEPLDIPIENEVTVTEGTIAPPVRGGAIIRIPARRTTYLRGTIALAGQDAAYGELIIYWPGGQSSSPIGKHGEVELTGVPAGRHRALVRSAKGECRFHLHAPAVSAQLGTLACGGKESSWQ